MNDPALTGIRVLDLSRVLAGPSCTQTLADLGAEVWKIENPVAGDDTRGWMPPEVDGESTYFMCCNRSKKSVAIDLKSPEGRQTLCRLAAKADVLVENFRSGALAEFRLDPETLAKVNPRLIYCSISGYGRSGPRAAEGGYDFTIQAESGLMAITGQPDGEPMKLGVAISDLVTGMNAVQAILAAIIAREQTGRGQHLDIALFDSAVALLANVASGYLQTGKQSPRYGNAHATVVPYQLFDSADGTLALACGNDGQFRALCQDVLDLPNLPHDPRYTRNRERVNNRDTLIPLLEAAFKTRNTADWLTDLKAAKVPGGKVRTVSEVFTSPDVMERGMITAVPDTLHGQLRLVQSPLRFSDTPVRVPAAPPRLGEHTEEVLRWLGDQEIQEA
ncbi:CaiB/BaiF CoA-transferase family protein [Puniceibacterium sp. IMCC21224]|uniref:CaiB/BaiF CoA transferase family protein n=1 Tax=Puniceibacterium sp. IMCC21224 TaxID=1618204 RepID=UPI00064DC554|nr:CoA transferase [Puniceibacterium sp. IMCC21224]KMK65062.1 putative acyl-CoA transferase/carnitine dehydratase [Puniceibacterium sp. IMCC21224]